MRLFRAILGRVPRGHRLSRLLWSPRLKRLGTLCVPTGYGFSVVVDPADHIGWSILTHGTYETSITALLCRELASGGTFVDVGANHGWFSLLAAALVQRSGGRVVAFEPQARFAALVRESAALNGFDHLTVVEAAVGDCRGAGVMQNPAQGNSGFARVSPSGLVPGTIPIVTLDDALADAHPTCIKIDVEGFEYRVLKGMRKLLQSESLKSVVVEVHAHLLGSLGDDASAVGEMLRENGFKLFAIAPRPDKTGNAVLVSLGSSPIASEHHVYARRGGPGL